jgi:hypothetical protein
VYRGTHNTDPSSCHRSRHHEAEEDCNTAAAGSVCRPQSSGCERRLHTTHYHTAQVRVFVYHSVWFSTCRHKQLVLSASATVGPTQVAQRVAAMSHKLTSACTLASPDNSVTCSEGNATLDARERHLTHFPTSHDLDPPTMRRNVLSLRWTRGTW